MNSIVPTNAMPQSKKQRFMEGGSDAVIRSGGSSVTEHLDDLSADVIEHILGCLGPVDIMRARCCKKWRAAAKETIVPIINFHVNSVEKYNAIAAMATALPNLQILTLTRPGSENKYNDGEDPYTWVRDEDSSDEEGGDDSYDIEIISNFRKLRSLSLYCTGLNGRYPALFNNFQLLQQLTINSCGDLKVNLEILGGLSSLKELCCCHDNELAGNINSLRVLKDKLEQVVIRCCESVEGRLMDLADFPRLRELNLCFTAVTGDVRDVGDHDFPNLEQLHCPSGVVGGMGHEFQHVSDVPSVIDAYQRLKERKTSLFTEEGNMYYWSLSNESPDWYEGSDDMRFPRPPFMIKFVKAGSRFGWRWCWCDRRTGHYSQFAMVNFWTKGKLERTGYLPIKGAPQICNSRNFRKFDMILISCATASAASATVSSSGSSPSVYLFPSPRP